MRGNITSFNCTLRDLRIPRVDHHNAPVCVRSLQLSDWRLAGDVWNACTPNHIYELRPFPFLRCYTTILFAVQQTRHRIPFILLMPINHNKPTLIRALHAYCAIFYGQLSPNGMLSSDPVTPCVAALPLVSHRYVRVHI
jgi:hypothetical protein